MVNPFREVNWRPDPHERRRFARSLVLGFPIVAAVLFGVGRVGATGGNARLALVVGASGAGLGLILWAVPRIARPFYVAWYGVACAIGFVVGNAALATLFYLLFTPLGLVLRFTGRRALRRGCDRRAATYWLHAPPTPPPERYFRQY